MSTFKRRLQRGLSLAAFVLALVALAAPQLGYHWEQVSRRGNNVVFAVDTSRSMSTPDVKPDRLTRAKLAIDDFIDKLDGDAVGLVAFAGNAFLACPITLDYGAFHETVNALDTNTIARGGTNITSAIHQAQAALARRPGSDKILILITDGEDLEGDSLDAARAAARDEGLKIFTIGVGTASGDLIPLTSNPADGFVKDESGAYVKSHLDEAALTELAKATGGFYAPLGRQGEGLEAVYQRVLGPLAKHELAARQQRIYNQRFQWPLAGSLLCLLASLMIGNRRRRTRPAVKPAPATATGRMAVLVPLLLSAATAALGPGIGRAADNADTPVLEFNAGTAAYKAGDYPKAAKAFTDSISHSPSNDAKRLADQEDAYYNLGNALYRAGQKNAQGSPQQAIEAWTQSIKAYDSALQLRPGDADSKFNRDYVKRKLDELKKQQDDNQQNQKQQGQGQGQGQSQGQGQGQGQGQQKPQEAQNQPPNQKQDPQQDPKQAQNPPGQDPQKQQPQQQSPQNAQNQPQPAAPKQGTPQGAPQDKEAGGKEDATAAADEERQPGQMSREEARELLDSVKGEEKKLPVAQRGNDDTNEKPYKNW